MIPRIFHRVWVGNSPIPDEYNEYWKKWQLLHSKGWQFINWDNDKIKQLSLYSLIQKVTSNAAKSDIARYEIIYTYGGIYLDCDMDCYQSIDSLIEENDEFIVCNQIDDFSCVCSNSFFAAKTQHRILKNAIEELTNHKSRSY